MENLLCGLSERIFPKEVNMSAEYKNVEGSRTLCIVGV